MMNLGFGIGFILPLAHDGAAIMGLLAGLMRDALAFIGLGCLMMLAWDGATRRSGWQDRDASD
jgi:hypothetical protein